MLKLKLIPRFARLLSAPSSPGGKVLRRGLAAKAGGDGEDAGDFYSKMFSEGPSPSEKFQEDMPTRQYGRQGSRFGGRGGGSSFMGGPRGRGRGGGGFQGRGGGRGRMSRDPFGIDDDHPAAPVALSEADLKLKQELDKKRAAQRELEAKKEADDREEEEEEDDDDGVEHSIYEGFIDPKYDDVIKERKMFLKRLRYKDQAHLPSKYEGEDDEEDLTYLDRDSSDDEAKMRRQGRRGRGQGRGRGGAVNARDQLYEDDVESGSEDEVTPKEWEMMTEMDNGEFERYLKHREHGKKLRKEYDARIAALGDKAEDLEEVKQIQKLVMKKWRAHYFIPRMVTPKEKEEMWEKHKENPGEWTVDKLADEYNVCKARVHAILFLWDMRKQGGESQTAEEETKIYLDNLGFDDYGKPCLPPHMGEDKWVTTWNTRPNYKIMPADWEGSVRTEEEAIEEASAKEEAMMLEEFVRRLEFNKLQMAGLMKQNKHERRRPLGGWTYLIEKLGPEGKRGKRGGFKFVGTADGKHRRLNELEKLVLKRESVRPRKRMV